MFHPAISADQDRTVARLHLLVLTVLGLTVFSFCMVGQFVFDDAAAIENNISIRSLWPLPGPLKVPPRLPLSGRPLVNFTFAVNYQISNLKPWSYHIVNIAIHVLNGLLVYLLTAWVLKRPQFRMAVIPHGRWLALMIASLWMVHPLQTEDVAYTTQRTELLFGFFLFLTIWSSTRAWSAWPGSRTRLGWTAAAMSACSLGMLCKEVMAVAPVMVLFFDRAFVSGSFKQTWLRHGRFHLTLAATWLVFAANSGSNPQGFVIGTHTGVDMSRLDYLRTQAGVILHYLRLCIWPHPILITYTWPVVRSFTSSIPPGLVILALLAASGWALIRNHWTGFMGAWFFLILAPSSSVVPIVTEVIALRRMYVPLLAVVTLLVGAIYAAARHLHSSTDIQGRHCALPNRITAPLTTVWVSIVLALSTCTAMQLWMYRDARALWRDSLMHFPDSVVAQNSLAVMALEDHDYESAIEFFGNSIEIDPNQPQTHVSLAAALINAGKLDQADMEFRRAIHLRPNMTVAWVGAGTVALRQNKLDQAQAYFQQAVQVDPSDTSARLNLVRVLAASGRIEQATVQARELVRLHDELADGHRMLGILLNDAGETSEAVEHLRRAIALDGGEPSTLVTLAWILATNPSDQIRNGSEALQLAQLANRKSPTREPQLLDTLAAALAETGDMAAAARTADLAADLAQRAGAGQLADVIKAHAILYHQGKPFRTIKPTP